MPAEAVLAAFRALAAAIAPLQLPVALLGGLALAVWKHPRFTKDVDVLVALEGTSTEELLNLLATAGFRPKKGDGIVKLGELELLQLVYSPADALVDVQVDLMLVQNDYQRQAIRRRVTVKLPGTGDQVGVLSCEDLILHKLIAGRLIDLADAAALLRANRESLDWGYIRPWASELELERELAQVWDEAFPGVPMPKSEP
jgi:hypothetical protein